MICPFCKEEIKDGAIFCKFCRSDLSKKTESAINRTPSISVQSKQSSVPTNNPPREMGQSDAALRMLLPVGRSGYAITAGYLALFSPLIIFAPFALVFGILGVRDIKKNKDKHGMGRAVFGIIMGALFSIALLFLVFRLLLH